LVQNPQIATAHVRLCRSAGVWPKAAIATAEASIAPTNSRRGANRLASAPNTALPSRPPTLVHTSTPAADEALNPMSTTIFGTHLMM
jgi:hypothetical protein